jgi:hypothetical protein
MRIGRVAAWFLHSNGHGGRRQASWLLGRSGGPAACDDERKRHEAQRAKRSVIRAGLQSK